MVKQKPQTCPVHGTRILGACALCLLRERAKMEKAA